MKFTALLFEHALLFVPERIPESRRNTMHQLIYNGFLCELYGLIGLIIAQISNDIHYQSMAFKRSAVRSRLSPPKNTRFHLKSSVFLYFSVCFVLGIFTLDNKWTTDLLNFFFLTAGRKKLWYLSKEKEQGANVFHTSFVCVWDVMKAADKFQRQCAGILLRT